MTLQSYEKKSEATKQIRKKISEKFKFSTNFKILETSPFLLENSQVFSQTSLFSHTSKSPTIHPPLRKGWDEVPHFLTFDSPCVQC